MGEITDVRRTTPSQDRPRTVRGQFDWSDIEPAVAAVETVAVATDRTPRDVYALNDAIDTDALNDLFRTDTAEAVAEVHVSFSFAGCEVTVHGDGRVEAELAV